MGVIASMTCIEQAVATIKINLLTGYAPKTEELIGQLVTDLTTPQI
jgi:hypothetical protein